MSVTTSHTQSNLDDPKTEKEIGLNVSTALFLAWAPLSHSRRSQLIAARLGIPLVNIYVLKLKRNLAPLRYLIQAVQTLLKLARLQPRVVFVQNPPIFAALMTYLYCLVARANFIIDSHTDALLLSTWEWSLPLHRFLSKRALLTIVTNEHLQTMISNWGAKTIIIRDVPSEFPAGRLSRLDHPFNIAMVSSYASDEPLEEVIAAAATLPDVGFYITGNPKWGHNRLPPQLPPNLHLTGFLSEQDYYGLLRSVQAVMALTTVNHTMQRGACEAVWLGQPIITSDWPLLREFFHKGTIHADNTTAGIRQAIVRMRDEHIHLAAEIEELQVERRKLWQQWVAELQMIIQQAGNGR